MGLDFAQMRRNMVESQIRTTDVTDLPLLDTLLDVPRELFVPQKQRPFAYTDSPILVSDEGAVPRYLLEPSTLARLVQLADLQADDLVLDVGCATGYSSAVLSRLGGALIALEEDEQLAGAASETLLENGFDGVAVVTGPLTAGLAEEGPYDVIFLNGAVDHVPQALTDQLKPHGRLVTVVGHGLTGFATLFLCDDEGVVSSRRAFNLPAKPLPGFQAAAQFAF